MILSDTRILEEIGKGTIKIVPYSRDCLGSNSYDVHLGKTLATYKEHMIDAKKHNHIDYFEIPDDVDCIFLFNPFDEIIMSAVVNNIFESLHNNPRKVKIIYANPLHKELFLKAGYKETWYSKKMKYIEAVILEN